jgi:hypothetical protein
MLGRGWFVMKLKFGLCLSLLAISMAASATDALAGSVDRRNFSIDTYTPTPNEVQLAEQRARTYWEKHRARYGSDTVYLAVQVSKVFSTEIVQNLWPKIINSETSGSFFSKGKSHNPASDLDLSGVMIFDTRTGHFVGHQGYVLVDTPGRGKSAHFGDYVARYIGTGRF